MAENYNIKLQIQGGEQPDIGFQVRDGATDGASARNAEAWAVGQRNGVDVPATDPTYHNNSKYYAGQAAHAEDDALASEGWAVGKQNGEDVPGTSPYYHNNSKYYAEQAGAGKANMVSGATAGNFASLKADGDLDDSGYKPSDFLTPSGITGKLDKDQGSANAGKFMQVGNDGMLTPANVPDPTGKADKVTGATSGDFAGLDANGNLTDSGKSASDFVASNQGAGNAGKALGIANDGSVTPVPFSGDDFTGATSSTPGVHGYVPAPAAGDEDKVLTGGGSWEQLTGAGIPMSSTDNTTVKAAIEDIANVVTEIPMTITPSDWDSTSPYEYEWSDNRVLADSSVEVEILDGSDSSMLSLSYEKSSGGGGIVFTPSSLPTANVYVLIVITNAEEHSGSSIDADTVSTDAVSGAANVDEALGALSAKLTGLLTIEQLPEQQISVTANTTAYSNINWGNVDKTKVLYSWLTWSNSANDQPSKPVFTYYDGTNKGCISQLVHTWSNTQTVKVYVKYIKLNL